MRSAYGKEVLRSITGSLGRFIAIAAIVGSAFSAIETASPLEIRLLMLALGIVSLRLLGSGTFSHAVSAHSGTSIRLVTRSHKVQSILKRSRASLVLIVLVSLIHLHPRLSYCSR